MINHVDYMKDYLVICKPFPNLFSKYANTFFQYEQTKNSQ